MCCISRGLHAKYHLPNGFRREIVKRFKKKKLRKYFRMSENSIEVAGNTIVQRFLLRTNVICTLCPLQHVRDYVAGTLVRMKKSEAMGGVWLSTTFMYDMALSHSSRLVFHRFFLTSVCYFCFSPLRLPSLHFSSGDTQTSFTPWLWITLRPPLFLLSFFLCFCFPTLLCCPSFSRMVCS